MKLNRLLLAGACFLGVIAVGMAGTDTAKKLVGAWKAVDGKEGAPEVSVEFTKDGKYILKAKSGDKELKLEGTYKVKGDTLSVALGKDMGTGKITKLTEKELVITSDDDGTPQKYQRLK